MPKTRAYGRAQQTAEAERAYAQRVKNRIRAEAVLQDMSMTQLMARAGLNYNTVMGRLDSGLLRVSDLARINAVLHMDAADLAGLVTLTRKERTG